jgi:hypothetical protein
VNYKKISAFILPKKIVRISEPVINYDNCATWRFDVEYEGGLKKRVFACTKAALCKKLQKYNLKKRVR